MTTLKIYEGPSALDGGPIVALAQTETRNSKTGDMMQTYILRTDMDPITANRTGADESICGACSLKGTSHHGNHGGAKERTCYVTLMHGPLGKYKAMLRGRYDHCEDRVAFGRGRKIRIGTYGDGLSVPQYVWEELLREADTWTAYTHQWNFFPDVYMTSVENIEQAQKAWARGERTFRVVPSVEDITSNEVLCPASNEAGKRTNCASCGLCKGATSQAKSIAIPAHGAGSKHYATLRDQRGESEILVS